jgi:hypothetical protein
MRKALMFVAGMALANTVQAQEFTYGVKAGINAANITFDDEGPVDFDSRIGLAAGAFVAWPLTPTVAIQPEALFSMKGATLDVDELESSINLTYLDIPILLTYTPRTSAPLRINVFGGPSVGLKLSAEAEADIDGESQEADIGDDIMAADLGVVIGAGIDGGRYTIDARYTWGLTDITDVDDDDTEIRNRVFSILFGIRFGR